MKFKELIAPIDQEIFYSEYYEKKPLLIKRGFFNFYDNLLNINDIDSFLLSDNLNFKDFKLLLNNQTVPLTLYSNSTGTAIDPQKLQDYKKKGALIVINNINRNIQKIADFFVPIESELKTSFQCNCYLSPENSQGFKVHYDTHDVFALQIYGKKTWLIYNSDEFLPCKIDNKELNFLSEDKLTPIMEIELEQGDLLYIPRGFYHKAYTTNQASAHIALNYSLIFGYKLISTLGKELHVNDFFRKTYPSNGFDNENYIREFKKELIDSIQKLTISDFDKLYQKRLDEARDINKFESHDVTLKTILQRRNNNEYTIQNDKFTCILKCGNSKVILPINFSLAISEIMKHSRITVENIPIEGSKYQLQIAKRLINEGLFKIEN